MPQLETSTFASQIFWLCICFFTMLFIMSKLIVPRIAEILALRKRKIDNYLERAKLTKEQAEETILKYHEALAKATIEANKSLAQTKEELNNQVNQKQLELSQRLHEQIVEGEAKIQAGKDVALQQVKVIAADLAIEIVKKIGLSGISDKELKTAIEKNVKE